MEHDGHYYLQSNGLTLDSTFAYGSEQDGAQIICEPIRKAKQPRVLIAGLGLGFALEAARQSLPQQGVQFVVTEPSQDLIEWHKTHLMEFHPEWADDTRIVFVNSTTEDYLRKSGSGSIGGMLISGDSGLASLKGGENGTLLTERGLQIVKESLKNGAVLVIRSTLRETNYEKILLKTGFEPGKEIVPATHKGNKHKRHCLWVMKKGFYQRRSRRR